MSDELKPPVMPMPPFAIVEHDWRPTVPPRPKPSPTPAVNPPVEPPDPQAPDR
jgi:hypothetical protein